MDTVGRLIEARSALCFGLAEALSDPPDWMAGSGIDWPLFPPALELARLTGAPALAQAVEALAGIPAEPLPARRRRYRNLLARPGRPSVHLYQSLAVDGRLAGPTMLDLEQIYRAVGLTVFPGELPDHVSVELWFVGWMLEQAVSQSPQRQSWSALAREFVRQHPARWWPNLARSLVELEDAVYAPLGRLLSALTAELERPVSSRPADKKRFRVPQMAGSCSLCGFCAQVCPTQALRILETDRETGLVLNTAYCIACTRCVQVCESQSLEMAAPPPDGALPRVLYSADRAVCPACGQPTVSQAELQAVADRLGERPFWLDYCLDCRMKLNGASLR
ncbi:MAG: 4Fe-4S dicluster domain-containing protein [Chloroflexi bacterium]|nr:MAG: 4Fe-4S dicluster domain-containing protein [Chloroflexota bacterium]